MSRSSVASYTKEPAINWDRSPQDPTESFASFPQGNFGGVFPIEGVVTWDEFNPEVHSVMFESKANAESTIFLKPKCAFTPLTNDGDSRWKIILTDVTAYTAQGSEMNLQVKTDVMTIIVRMVVKMGEEAFHFDFNTPPFTIKYMESMDGATYCLAHRTSHGNGSTHKKVSTSTRKGRSRSESGAGFGDGGGVGGAGGRRALGRIPTHQAYSQSSTSPSRSAASATSRSVVAHPAYSLMCDTGSTDASTSTTSYARTMQTEVGLALRQSASVAVWDMDTANENESGSESDGYHKWTQEELVLPSRKQSRFKRLFLCGA